MEKLNKDQLEAAIHKDGPLLIVAGAGTGKTTVITHRIAYIIEQGWAKSDEILALTFTEKAASEMEERVDRLLPMGYLDLWISTFHGFGERILKDHGIDMGIPGDFKLLNEFEQYSLMYKNLEKFNLDYYRPLGNPTKFIKTLIKHFSRAKDEDISPDNYLEYAEDLKQNLDNMLSGKSLKNKIKKSIKFSKFNSEFPDADIAQQEIIRINEVANAYHIYQQLLLDNNALDFGDLINYCLKLFRERGAILEKYRKQFKYILLDEFQDTNWAQYELVKMLASPKNNLVVVGDDDQSIYKFRGASVSNILQFKKDYKCAKQIFLVNNYRNRQNILDLSYKFITQNNPNRLEYVINKNEKIDKKLNKKLIAQAKGKGNIEVIKGNDLHDEISKVIEKIADLKRSDKKLIWNDFAILVRANESAKEFCSFLEEADFPYLFLSSKGLYSKPVIMDIISYLKLLDNYHENSAMYRILNLPIFYFSYRDIVNFNFIANKKAWSLYTVLSDSGGKFGSEVQKKIDKVLNLISKHTALARHKNISEVFISFLNDSGYLKYLLDQGEEKSKEFISFLNQFIKRIRDFESSSSHKSVKAFLSELQMEIDSGNQGNLPIDIESGPEAIKVMTIHGSKGLEFKHVFIVNMVDKRFPTIERKEPILIPDSLIKEILPEGDIHLQEERRLFYVAMTRAKEGLYFSWAPDYGGARDKKPSRFLIECNLAEKNFSFTNNLIDKKRKNMLEKKYNKNNFSKNKAIRIPSYFSYTQLAAFSNCPYQYYFAHILRIPRYGKAQFSFGKTMHSTLQKIFELISNKSGLEQTGLFGDIKNSAINGKKIKIDFNEILELYEQSWIDDWYESKKQKDEHKKKGKEILKGFYNKYKDKWPNAIFLEKGFNFKINVDGELCTIRGAIDRIDDDQGKIKIIDYKTGAPRDKLDFSAKEQLLLYQLALQEIFKQEIKSLAFYYLNNNSEVEFLGSDEELSKIKNKIIKDIKEIKKGYFPPKPGPLCQYCDFKDICEHKKNNF